MVWGSLTSLLVWFQAYHKCQAFGDKIRLIKMCYMASVKCEQGVLEAKVQALTSRNDSITNLVQPVG